MNMKFVKIEECDVCQYKADIQEAFQIGAIEGGFTVDGDVILPETDIDKSLNKENALAYKVMLEDKMVGGAIVVLNEKNGYLDFLYVKHGRQGKGIGKFMWSEIERQHPEIKVWETCTPYFERRNIHFYINVCGFHAVEYFSKYHPDPNTPEDYFDDGDDFGMFHLEKILISSLEFIVSKYLKGVAQILLVILRNPFFLTYVFIDSLY